MSSDSDCEFSYTNAASLIRRAKEKDISFNSDLETSKNKFNFFDEQQEERNVCVTRSESKDIINNDTDNCIILSDKDIDEDVSLSNEILQNTCSRNKRPRRTRNINLRQTRQSKNTDNCIILSDEDTDVDATPIVKRTRGRRNQKQILNIDENDSISTTNNVSENTRSRARRKGRVNNNNGRQTRNKSKQNLIASVSILDSSESNIEPSSDMSDINYEITVKVYWKSQHVEKFTLKRFEKFTTIFEHFSKKENVPESRLLFTMNDNIISKHDTPNTLNMNAATIIEGGILSENFNVKVNNKNQDLLELKIQMKDRKHPLLVSMRSNDKMEILMCQCAQELNVPLKKLKFYFDGDQIEGDSTPIDLEFEGGEVIDCIR